MLSIYTTEKILSTIFHDGEDKYVAWYSLIKKIRPKLNVLFNKDSTYQTDNSNPVFVLENIFDLNVVPEFEECEEENLLAKVASMNPDVNLDPCTVIIMDIDKKTAHQISKKYGVICHTLEENPETIPLFQEAIERSVDKGEKKRGWNELIRTEATFPSNFLVFIDRYLFSSDSGKINSNDGIDNVFEILKLALPQSLGVDYHILFIFDATKLDSHDNFERISTKLNGLKKKLNRPFNIVLETISLSKDDFNYDETHNRRILSNYFLIRVDRSLKAFRGNQSLYTQSVWLDWAASKGIVRQLTSDTPAKSLYKYLRETHSTVTQLKKSNGEVLFTQNGNHKISIQDISHRILNP